MAAALAVRGGGAVGVPLGVAILEWADPGRLRTGIGVLLVAYSVYALVRPDLKAARSAGPLADAAAGVANGVVGGMTGLAGIVVTAWCGLRGWPKDVQRAVFQPVAVAVFVMAAVCLNVTRSTSADAARLFVLGLPFLRLGTWAGLKAYGHLDEAQFRKLVLLLLGVSGVVLAVQSW